MKKLKYMLMIAICIGLTSQIYFNFFVPGFIITCSVIVFSISLYLYYQLNPLITAFVTATIGVTIRGLIVYFNNRDFYLTFKMVVPDTMFFITFGAIFYFFYYKNINKDLTRFYFTIFFCDMLSNIVEMSVRVNVTGMTTRIISDIAIIAAIRSLITFTIIIIMKYYKSFLIKEEHEEQYRRLMIHASNFKSEIYFMKKNAAEIEDVMKKSYMAYKIISDNNYPSELKELALDISKDVHEIKKDYIRAIKGLEDIPEFNNDDIRMSILDIVEILEVNVREHIRKFKLDIKIDYKIKIDFHARAHFYLMTILNNLIMNSIESIEKRKNGIHKLIVEEIKNDYVFTISDNGYGIKESNMDFIFNHGFSTKFDKDTGNIGRGIGLSIVKDLVENVFKGEIKVVSTENKGAAFIVKLPKSFFEEE